MIRILAGLPAFLLAALGLASAAGAAEEVFGRPFPWQLNLQSSVTPVMDGIWDLWTILLWLIAVITAFVLLLLFYVMWRYSAKRNPAPTRTTHNSLLEVAWTAIPVMILAVLAVPSFKLHYLLDVVPESELTIKAVGNQFYWSQEYPDHDIAFDSAMVPDEELAEGQPRLLEVDNRLVVPVATTIRMIVSASDVIHSWAVPAFGVKIDAIPGRLNETWFRAEREGVYYGQCSELCGAGHGYMPIAVEVVSKPAFEAWLVTARERFAGVAPETVAARLSAK